MGIELPLRDVRDPAVIAHLDQFESLRGILEHPVFVRQLCDHLLDRALDAEWLMAADTAERLFVLQHPDTVGDHTEIELGLNVMTFSGQVALHRPHCTQASSAKRSIGRSGSSATRRSGTRIRRTGRACNWRCRSQPLRKALAPAV